MIYKLQLNTLIKLTADKKNKGKHSVLEMYKLVKIIDSFYNSNSVKSMQVDFT